MSNYIRTKTEVNKQQILGDRETLGPSTLHQFGMSVTQAESFFIEPKVTDTDASQTTQTKAA